MSRSLPGADADLVLRVEDRSKFAGRLYQYKGMRALRVARPLEPYEPL